MQRLKFANNYFYHVYNRGVDKRSVFLDDKDYHRFLFCLRDFNDKNSSVNLFRRINRKDNVVSAGNPISHRQKVTDVEPLVKIHASCLMPNHFHMILEQIVENGISKFMQKMGVGYTNYFNLRYERSGVLFQGKFKAVLVDNDAYLDYLKQYIYMNPLDLMATNWKEGGLKNWRRAKNFLKDYKWTNCKNYDKYDEFLRANKQKQRASFEEIKEFIIE